MTAASFDTTFFESLGLGDLSEEQRAQLADTMAEAVMNRIVVRLHGELTEEELEGLDDAVAGGDEAMFGYLQSVLPNYAEVMQDEINRYKNEMVRDAAVLNKSID
jgi:hypothetical protein